MKADLPRFRALLPPHLHTYLDEEIVVSAWYPCQEYLDLLRVLALTIDPAPLGGTVQHVYRSFGIMAARRDLRGDQEQLREEVRLPKHQRGLYRGTLAYGR